MLAYMPYMDPMGCGMNIHKSIFFGGENQKEIPVGPRAKSLMGQSEVTFGSLASRSKTTILWPWVNICMLQ